MDNSEIRSQAPGTRKRSLTMELGVAAAVLVLVAFFLVTRFNASTGMVTVTANMSPFSPNPVKVKSPATSSLSASYSPPSGVPEGDLSAQYDWSISVQYKAKQVDNFASAPSGSYTATLSPTQPSGSPNATLTFTPLVAAYWRVFVSCEVTVSDTSNSTLQWIGTGNAGPEQLISYTLDITYTGPAVGGGSDNGTVVTNKTTDVHAGWPIEVGVCVAPTDLANEFDWTIDGSGGNGSAAIAGYSPTTQSAAVDALGPQYGYSVLYYYTAAGSHNVSVTTRNGYEVPPVTTTFSVAKPSSAMTATYQFAARITSASGGQADYIYLGAVAALAHPSLDQSGIKFGHSIIHNSEFSGHSYYLQVYTGNQYWTGIPPVTDFPYAGSGLDGSDPYGGNVVVDGEDWQGDSPALPTDKYTKQVKYSSLTVDDSPKMWVMYTPAASGSITIPIDSAPWHWGGDVTWNAANKTWSLVNPTPAASASFNGPATDTFPIWDGVWVPQSPPS